MKVRDVLRLLSEDGWVQIAQVGSHRQFVHDEKPGRLTVAGHRNADLHPKTLASILVQAGLR